MFNREFVEKLGEGILKGTNKFADFYDDHLAIAGIVQIGLTGHYLYKSHKNEPIPAWEENLLIGASMYNIIGGSCQLGRLATQYAMDKEPEVKHLIVNVKVTGTESDDMSPEEISNATEAITNYIDGEYSAPLYYTDTSENESTDDNADA